MEDGFTTGDDRESRRRVLKKMGALGAAAWVAPTVVSVQGAAAQSAETPDPPLPPAGPCAPAVSVVECTASWQVQVTNTCTEVRWFGNRPDGIGMLQLAPGASGVLYFGQSSVPPPRGFAKATQGGPVLYTYLLPVPCQVGPVTAQAGCIGGVSWGCYPPWG